MPAVPRGLERRPSNGGYVEHKVLSQRGTPGKSSPEQLEQMLNSAAAEGWRVVSSFMVSSPWTLSTSQIMVVRERGTAAAT